MLNMSVLQLPFGIMFVHNAIEFDPKRLFLHSWIKVEMFPAHRKSDFKRRA